VWQPRRLSFRHTGALRSGQREEERARCVPLGITHSPPGFGSRLWGSSAIPVRTSLSNDDLPLPLQFFHSLLVFPAKKRDIGVELTSSTFLFFSLTIN